MRISKLSTLQFQRLLKLPTLKQFLPFRERRLDHGRFFATSNDENNNKDNKNNIFPQKTEDPLEFNKRQSEIYRKYPVGLYLNVIGALQILFPNLTTL
jgi:hypothetical protein